MCPTRSSSAWPNAQSLFVRRGLKQTDNNDSNLSETTCHSKRELLRRTVSMLKKYWTRTTKSCHRVPSQHHLCPKKNRAAVNLWLMTSYIRSTVWFFKFSLKTSRTVFDFWKAGSRSGQIHLWHKPIYFTRFRLDMKLVPTRILNGY